MATVAVYIAARTAAIGAGTAATTAGPVGTTTGTMATGIIAITERRRPTLGFRTVKSSCIVSTEMKVRLQVSFVGNRDIQRKAAPLGGGLGDGAASRPMPAKQANASHLVPVTAAS